MPLSSFADTGAGTAMREAGERELSPSNLLRVTACRLVHPVTEARSQQPNPPRRSVDVTEYKTDQTR